MKQPNEYIIIFEPNASVEAIDKIKQAIDEMRKKESLIFCKETIGGMTKITQR